MLDHTEPTVSGELIVCNGRQIGATFSLCLPVTLIGAAETCDIRLTAPGIADIIGLIAFTPAGPVFRSWQPRNTAVNGHPTRAAILKHGDTLQIGPCQFELAWHAEELVPLIPAEAELIAELVPLEEEFTPLELVAEPECFELVPISDEEWSLAQREQDLHEQERRVAAELDDRHRKLVQLHHQLADGREQLRLDRDAQNQRFSAARDRVKQMKTVVQPLHQAARAERKKVRKLLRQVEAQAAAQQRSVQAERAELERERQALREEALRQEARFADTRRRLTEAAELLATNQKRVLVDRQEAETYTAQRERTAAERVRIAEAQQQTFEAGRERLEARAAELLQEIQQLETRATQTRAGLQELEQKRARIAAELTEATVDRPMTHVVTLPDIVPLDRRSDRSADQLLQDLHLRERELHREQLTVAEWKAEYQSRLADLADERAILTEQVAALAVAKEQWQSTEMRTITELESAARAVHAWEQSLTLREREAAALDQRRRKQADDLWQLRVKLEGWQAALMTFEETAAAERERTDADLTARREQLARWEAGLEQLCKKWIDARYRDRDAVQQVMDQWAAARTQLLNELAERDRSREQTFTEAVRLAAEAAAVEQTRSELEAAPAQPGLQATRRLRVLRRKWDKQFSRYFAELDSRKHALAAEAAEAEKRILEWNRTLWDVADSRIALTEAEQASTVRQLIREREIEEQALALTAEEIRRHRTDVELATMRDENERLAACLIATGPLPLQVIEPLPTIHPLTAYRRAA
ncbi:MAG: hypothetical protein LC104_11675 [Bacteroidales bacterium]|nr:hypothetical protein [Bacteroidales bacterium]